MVAMRDKIRNIKPFKQGPAQRTEEDYQDNKFNEKIKELENRRLVDQTTQENISTPEDDSPTQQASTLISNPFDGVRALANQTVGGIQNMFGIDKGFRDGPYGSLTSLRRANNATDPETKQLLSRSAPFNQATQATALLSGSMLAAGTVADLAQGDPTAALLKRAKGVKQVYNTAKTAYIGYKGGKSAYANRNKVDFE
tara:strand:- start:86 stop:679 length:594 start_codon:yes stop_codon:yes gene_type:complete